MENVKKILLHLLVIALFACGEKSQQAETSDTASTAAERSIEIKSGGDVVASLKLQGEEAEIRVGDTKLHGRARKGEKRKYETNGDVTAEIKYSDDGFKLRSADGQLRWKVKIYDDKIKISNNEDGDNAYQVRESDADKVKVKLNDTEIGAARAKQEGVKISTEDGSVEFEIENMPLQKAHAVLAIVAIPLPDRIIIFNELLK